MNRSTKFLCLKHTKTEDYKELTDAMQFQKGFGEDASWGRTLVAYVWSIAFTSVQGQKAAKYLQSSRELWLRSTSDLRQGLNICVKVLEAYNPFLQNHLQLPAVCLSVAALTQRDRNTVFAAVLFVAKTRYIPFLYQNVTRPKTIIPYLPGFLEKGNLSAQWGRKS